MSERLRIVCQQFRHAVSAANRNNDRRGRGGQQVSFHGDFCSAQPSVLTQLTRWAREMETAANEDADSQLGRGLTEEEGYALRILREDIARGFGVCRMKQEGLAVIDKLLAGAK